MQNDSFSHIPLADSLCHHRYYQSLLSAMSSSFAALKRRLNSKAVGGVLFLERPLFAVDVQLRMPDVVLHPSLDELQEAINATAKRVLQAMRELHTWGSTGGVGTGSGAEGATVAADTATSPRGASCSGAEGNSYYDAIMRDPDIVKVSGKLLYFPAIK